MNRFLPFICALLIFSSSQLIGQYELFQFFDGNDTLEWQSIHFEFGADSSGLWQVGPPQKVKFSEALSAPNVLVTDTLQPYIAGLTDTVGFRVATEQFGTWGVLMLRWTQKLDMRDSLDLARVEFKAQGMNWQSAFDNPYVYDFYGFDQENVHISTHGLGFTGMDTTWKDIWLCYDMTFLDWEDSLEVRFVFDADTLMIADSLSYDGWMMDNFMEGITVFHTLAEEHMDTYMKVYPTLADDRIYIETQKQQQAHSIELVEFFDLHGRSVASFGKRPVKTFVDVGGLPAGAYLMRVQTNIRAEDFQIIIEH